MAAQDWEFEDDMTIEDGDFKIIESDQQHIQHIVQAKKGQYYEFPTLGAGADDLLNSSISKQRINQIITESLVQDDYVVKDIFITTDGDNTTIEIDAKRRR